VKKLKVNQQNQIDFRRIYNVKRKIFSILFALVLLCSFSLVTAVPAAGATTADYNAAVIKAADRLAATQNDDGGFDWILDLITNETSYTNILGISAMGILKAYELDDKSAYETALAKAYKYVVDNPPTYTWDGSKYIESAPKGVDSSPDITFLVWLAEAADEDATLLAAINDLQDPDITAVDIATLAKTRWDDRVNHLGSDQETPLDGTATAMAEYIRDARYAARYFDCIPWDLEAAVKAALALETYYSDGYDQQAVDIAEVIYDSLYGEPVYFDISVTDQYAYIHGITGALEAFEEVSLHPTEAADLKDILLNYQQADGSWDLHDTTPVSWSVQDTAYAVMALLRQGESDAVAAAQKGADWLVLSQLQEGGWSAEGGTGDEYPEVDSEAAWALATMPALALDEDWYRTGETVFVTVEDPAANNNPLLTDWVKVNTISDFDVAGISVNLQETGANTGVFEGSFLLVSPPPPPLPPPPTVMVNDGDLITVTYRGITDTATVDDTLPVIAIGGVTSPTNILTQTISGTFTELNLDEIVLTVNDGLPQTAAVDEQAGTWEVVDVPLVEVDNFIVATITDMIGNSATADAYIELDTTAPTGSIDIPDINIYNVLDVPVTILSDEDGTFIWDIGGVVVGGGGIAADVPIVWQHDFTPVLDGPVTASVTFTDGHGNVSGPFDDQAFKDTLAPAEPSYLDAPAYINDANQATYTVTGFADADSTVEVRITDGATATNTGTATGGTFSIAVDCSTLDDGTDNIIIDAKATDAAGNESSYCTPITRSKDTVSPTVEIASILPGPTNVQPIGIRVTFSEDVTGFELADITVGNGTADRFSGTGANYLFAVTPTADGVIRVNIAAGVAEDLAGNPNGAARQFSITYDSTPPEVTVLSPNGGENWLGGSIHDITWTADDVNFGVTPITIEYSLNGGINWDTIAADVENTGVYPWVVPNLSSGNCLVRVTAVDLAGNSGSDGSNSVFTMSSDTIAPAVTVNSPNGGESWQGRSTQTITWTATDDKTPGGSLLVDLYFSSNGGTDWGSIASDKANNGAYSWVVPEVNSRQCLVKVEARDTSGNIGRDVSDRVFTITIPEAPVQPTDTIELETSWNLISLMLIPTSSNITDVLTGIEVVSVWAYDASIEDPDKRWSSYAPGKPGDLETMVDGKGYWVEMSAGATLVVQGEELPDPPTALPAYSVVEGWNLIGFKSTTPRTADSYLLAIEGKYTLVRGYNGIYFTIGTGENLDPGSGYWISITESGTIYP